MLQRCVRRFSASTKPVIGLLREECSVWERRAPINPSHVGKLVKEGVKVLVQPSTRRAYSILEYEKNGGIIQDDISEADTILGVKSVPLENLIPRKKYAFFSHTIKAQPESMHVLDALLAEEICLLDYEKMVNEKGMRVVAFGKMAGIAGMVNVLHGLGLRLLALGYHTPFMHIGCAHNYAGVSATKEAIASLGREIQYGLLPEVIGPMIFTFTGAGNVSQGAQEVFRELPHEFVSPADLPEVAKKGDTRTMYATVVDMKDHLVNNEGHEFNVGDFFQYPERYHSNFAEKVLPYTTCLINGIYWAPGQPRLATREQCQSYQAREIDLHSLAGRPKLPQSLLAICDISADINGSIGFSRITTIDAPFVLYDAHRETFVSNSMSGPGIVFTSLDNAPAQLPRESTDFFGQMLLPHLDNFINLDISQPLESQLNVSEVIRNAIITQGGKLTRKFQYIDELRKQQGKFS